MPPLASLFATPWALALGALLPLIVLMYLLKLKRRPQVVPSTLLWRRAVQDMVANAPFQRLRNNLLLWLQLLALLLIILALARPMLRMQGLNGQTLIVLLDLSASMNAEENDGATRLDKAKRLALRAVEEMNAGGDLLGAFAARDQMMILGFADRALPLQTLTSDKALLRAAIEGAEAFHTENNLEDVGYLVAEKAMMEEAGALVPNPRARVILISDGALGPSLASLADVVNLEFLPVGTTEDNLGFTGAEVRESFAGNFEYQLFASLVNASAEPRTAFVELQVAGEVQDLKQIELAPRGEGSVVFTLPDGLTGLATISLTNHSDALPLDDLVRLQVAPPTELKVQIVTRGNPFLVGAFSSDPRCTVSTLRPGEFTPATESDITIFDNSTTGELPPGNYIFINAVPPASMGYTNKGEAKSPRIVDWNRAHPFTRFVSFDNVLVFGSALKIEPPREAIALVSAEETELVTYLETEERRVLAVSFDILKSYWPLDVSFPIFFGNVLDVWARAGKGLGRAAFPTGGTIPVVPPREAQEAIITLPGGKPDTQPLAGRSTLYLTETQRTGLYSVRFGEMERVYPVNMASALESNIAPVQELEVGGRTVKGDTAGVKGSREIWPWLALVALALLLLEWWVYTRRTFM